MPNPLYNQFGGKASVSPYASIINDAKRLRQNVSNPRQEVERLLNSGRMSQAQFNQLSQMAQQILQLMGNE